MNSAESNPSRASAFRRTEDASVGIPTPDEVRFDVLRAIRVRSVGTAFLRARPWIVAPVAAANAALLVSADGPAIQRRVLGAMIATMVFAFFVESFVTRRAIVSERWLGVSLAATAIALALGAALSGGAGSPMLPLLFAPVFIALAAFGRSAATRAMLALAVGLVVALGFVPLSEAIPPISPGASHAMLATSTLGLAALTYVGAGGLVDAYSELGRVLERMRLATIEESTSRARATERVGAVVAHDLKNPLAAVKAIVQLLAGSNAGDERASRRLEVALSELDRMHAVIDDYLSSARPLGELRLEPVNLRVVVADVLALLEPRAGVRSVALELRGDEVTLRVDARRIREALFNLVENAMAASPNHAAVLVTIEAHEAEVRVHIDDDGRGIPTAFVHDEAAAFVSGKPDGTGLGVPIARAAAEHHGGSLVFSHRTPRGTRATLRLPRDFTEGRPS